ncbi:MAG: hypothetical protein JWP01_2670 [Myxococcales bacterium]|nr:hypothetical protein [Myxococcales bacterium]
MSYGNEEASTHRRVVGRIVHAPEFLDGSDEASTEPPTRVRADATPAPYRQRSAVQPYVTRAPHEQTEPSVHVRHARGISPAPMSRHAQPAYVPHERTQPSVHALQPVIEAPRSDAKSSSRSKPADVPVEVPRSSRSTSSRVSKEPRSAAPAPAPDASAHSASAKSAPKASTSAPSASTSASQPAARPSEAPRASEPAMPGMIDPLQIIIPPELGPTIYSWVRRLALQADLQTADRVLRDALLEISSSLAISIVYPGQEGLWTLGADDEIPRDSSPLVACAQARRALIASHTALIPVVTTSETVAVIVLTRNPRNPGYLPVEQIAMIGLARESASILHHLAVQHLQKATEIKADKGSLYRGEALEAHRTRGTEGELVQLSPSWVKRAYPVLIATVVIATLFSVFIKVPTYSSGGAVILIDGAQISAPLGGTVDAVLVQPGQAVKVGTAIVRLSAQAELDEYNAANTEYVGATQQHLLDQTDEQTRKAFIAAAQRKSLAEARVSSKTVRAAKAGTISDIRVRAGQALQPGEPIATVVQPGAEIEVSAFLPSKDRPRLRVGQTLQVELIGFTKPREKATISFVGTEAIGSTEAAKVVGPTLADALKLPGGSYVHVRARLPARTFKTEHNRLSYHHGMLAATEVLISEKPFLVSLLPALEKYLPD